MLRLIIMGLLRDSQLNRGYRRLALLAQSIVTICQKRWAKATAYAKNYDS